MMSAAFAPTSKPRMSVSKSEKAVTLSLPSGAETTIQYFGAHVTSWKTSDGKERLYLSTRNTFDGSSPIRGGVPIAWPNVFGGPTKDEVAAEPALQPNAAISKQGHAFVRTRTWSIASSTASSATFELDPKTYPPEFPQAVRVAYTVTLTDDSLTMSLKSINPADSGVTVGFKTFFHNYIAVSDARKITVSGLKSGLTYKDTAKAGQEFEWEGGDIRMDARVGKIFMSAVPSEGLIVNDGSDSVRVTTHGLPDCFMWNPQENAGKAAWSDMEPGDGDKFAGVEPGYFHAWKLLAPGEQYVGGQTFALLH